MNRQQYNETIKKVISSPRSDLQKMNMLENAFALYVKEETDRIVAELEKRGYLISVNDGSKCIKVSVAIDIVKADGVK